MASPCPRHPPHLHLMADMGFCRHLPTEPGKTWGWPTETPWCLSARGQKTDQPPALPYTDLTQGNAPDLTESADIFVHFICSMVCHWLRHQPGVRVQWVFYGAEVYRNPLALYSGLLPKTAGYARGVRLKDFEGWGYHVVQKGMAPGTTGRPGIDGQSRGIRDPEPGLQHASPLRTVLYGKALLDVRHLLPTPSAPIDQPPHPTRSLCPLGFLPTGLP